MSYNQFRILTLNLGKNQYLKSGQKDNGELIKRSYTLKNGKQIVYFFNFLIG